jgi:hypothetical protein
VTLLDAVALDLRNSAGVLDGDQAIRDGLRRAAWLGSKMNEEMVMLRMQMARFANETSECAWRHMGWAE